MKDRSEDVRRTAAEALKKIDPSHKPYRLTITNGPQELIYEDGALVSQKGKLPPAQAQKSSDGWPGYVVELVGKGEVRVRNDNQGSGVKVGLRAAGNKGKDFSVPPGGAGSASVPGGTYEIFFQFGNEPKALYKGDDVFVAEGTRIEIKLGTSNGNYRIQRVK
jgi:hypothetical protein